MSVRTWKKEFYSAPMKFIKIYKYGEPTTTQLIEAVDHSLKKWEGALPKNIKRHNVRFHKHDILGSRGDSFLFGADSCSLCQITGQTGSCWACPIAQVGQSCSEHGSPYLNSANNPTKMIQELKDVREFLVQKLPA